MVKPKNQILSPEAALLRINDIRNSIIGLQNMNWSEHIYSLVAILEEAGIEGMGYDAAHKKYGTMLERTNKAEARCKKLEYHLRGLVHGLPDLLEKIGYTDEEHLIEKASDMLKEDG